MADNSCQLSHKYLPSTTRDYLPTERIQLRSHVFSENLSYTNLHQRSVIKVPRLRIKHVSNQSDIQALPTKLNSRTSLMDQPILANSIESNSDAQLVEGGWIIAEPKVFTLNLGLTDYTHHTSGPVG